MTFITIMNYTDPDDIIMCKGWFYFVRKFHPTAEIIVYYNDALSDELIRDDVTYKKLDVTNVPMLANKGKINKLAIHREWDKYDQFIYMDADAYPLADLQPMFDNCRKPITYCGHDPGEGAGPTHLNSGVLVQKSKLFNYDNLIDIWLRSNKRLKYAGTDQALCQMHFEDIGYSPFDYNIMGHEYNSCANATISIIDGNVSAISNITKKQIKVLHGYGCYRFSSNSNTKKFWNYIKNI